MTRIERLGPRDVDCAEKVIRAFKGSARPRESLEAFLSNTANYLLVADAGEEVGGFLMAYRLERADREASQMFLYEIGVAEPWRGRGLAKALIHEITELARGEGMFEAFVLTSRGNEAAQQLYARTGGIVEDESAMLFVYPFRAAGTA
ncbi:MAG: GNAT family N-acetyltransferase [Acidobacteriota bacterium]|nr:GNAT family N-acetyltransferase [Acidobacteriota bacterium]